MRSRGIIFLLLSGLLAIVPWVQWHRQQALCLRNQGISPTGTVGLYNEGSNLEVVCPNFEPPSRAVHALGILSAGCFAVFLFFLFQGIAERRQEQALLRRAGVYVPEEDLPLEE